MLELVKEIKVCNVCRISIEIIPTASELQNSRENDCFLCSKRTPTVCVLKRWFLAVVYFAAKKTVVMENQWMMTTTAMAKKAWKTFREDE